MSGHACRTSAFPFRARQLLSVILLCFGLFLSAPPSARTLESLPTEPDLNTRIDELYDHEARLLLFLYSLKGNGEFDYVAGRFVREHTRGEYGNPVYYTEAFPMFYWWNHTMWSDPEQDGVNGNERVYQENVDFDKSRYKPCLFNGQPC
jgi:hypothetical protein